MSSTMSRATAPSPEPAMPWASYTGNVNEIRRKHERQSVTETAIESLRNRVRRLRRLDACAVSDALDRLGLTGVVSQVPQQSGTGRIAGAAVTLRVGVGDPPAGPPRHLGTNAIDALSSDHVI